MRLRLQMLTALLALGACDISALPAALKGKAGVTPTSPNTSQQNAGPRAAAMPSVATDCSISLPPDYPISSAMLGEETRSPINPSVIAWHSGAWGTIVTSWQITRGGVGCFIENERRLPDDKGKPTTHKFEVSTREFDDIAATLNYERLNAQMTNCENFMSDAENGSYDWYGQGRMSFVLYNKGDKCTGSDAFYQTMENVTARVKALITP